jgi:hypothetical protein
VTIPPPFREISSGQVELRQGGGKLSLFGIPFFLAGIGIILSGLRVLPMPSPSDGFGWMNLFFCLFGLVFAGIGGAFLFGRTWTLYDIARGSIVQSQGLLVPMRQQERMIGDFDEVLLTYQAADQDSSERYPIRLQPVRGNTLDVWVAGDFAEAYRTAEFLARFLNKTLADTTTGHTLRFAPDQIGETLLQRLRKTLSPPEVVERPATAVSEVQRTGEGVRIATPRADIAVSRNGIQIERGKKTIEVSAADILDVDYSAMDELRASTRRAMEQKAIARGTVMPKAAIDRTAKVLEGIIKLLPSQGITVKSRQGMFTFGEGLEVEELRYIQSVIQKALLDERKSS